MRGYDKRDLSTCFLISVPWLKEKSVQCHTRRDEEATAAFPPAPRLANTNSNSGKITKGIVLSYAFQLRFLFSPPSCTTFSSWKMPERWCWPLIKRYFGKGFIFQPGIKHHDEHMRCCFSTLIHKTVSENFVFGLQL